MYGTVSVQPGVRVDEPGDQPGCEPETRPVLKLEVEVWLGGVIGVATATDNIAAFYILPGFDSHTIRLAMCEQTVLAGVVFDDDVVAGALAESGVDVGTTYYWELPDSTVTVRSTDPERIELDVESDHQNVSITVTDDLDVLAVTVDE